MYSLIFSISLLLSPSWRWLCVVLSLTVISVLLAVVLSEMKNESKRVPPPAGVSHQSSCCRSAGSLLSILLISSISRRSRLHYIWLQHVFKCNKSPSSSHHCGSKTPFITGVLLTDCTLVPRSVSHNFNVSSLNVSGTLSGFIQK